MAEKQEILMGNMEDAEDISVSGQWVRSGEILFAEASPEG